MLQVQPQGGLKTYRQATAAAGEPTSGTFMALWAGLGPVSGPVSGPIKGPIRGGQACYRHVRVAALWLPMLSGKTCWTCWVA
jgi:hypothetical protein